MRSNLMLALTALIWGAAFVAQSVSMDYIGPFTFNAARFFIGGVVLIPCMFFLRKWKQEGKREEKEERERRKYGVIGGICCGTALFVASAFQQIGVANTTVGKAGFITALYIVIVPLLGIFLKRKVAASVWVSVAAAIGGMYLLCMTEGSMAIGKGDLSVLIGSVCFSFHILIIDHFSPKADGVFLSCVQFFTAGILAFGPSWLIEHADVQAILEAWMPILYAGILSCGVAYTLQVVAQKDTDPVIASLILSLESVFSVIAGWVILGETLTVREMAGCAVVFCAICLAQLPEGFFQKHKKQDE